MIHPSHPTVVLSEVKSTIRLQQLAQQKGSRLEFCPTGHACIRLRMGLTGAHLAGELSGHLFLADQGIPYDDGLYVALRILAILSQYSQKVSDHFLEFPKVFQTHVVSISAFSSLEQRTQILEIIEPILASQQIFGTPVLVDRTDGLRCVFSEQSWGLIRCSQTEPKLILRFESASLEEVTAIQHLFYKTLRDRWPDFDWSAVLQPARLSYPHTEE